MEHPVVALAESDMEDFMASASPDEFCDSSMEEAAQLICNTAPTPLGWQWSCWGGIEFFIVH